MDENLKRLKLDKSVRVVGSKRAYLKTAIIAVAIIAAIVAGYVLFTPEKTVKAVTVARVFPSQAVTMLNSSGYVVAQRKASVASKVTGRMVALKVEEGSKVKEGDVLARLESVDVEAAKRRAAAALKSADFELEHAKSELTDATLNYRRLRELSKSGVISKSDFDTAETRFNKANAQVKSSTWKVEAAKAALLEAEASLDYTLIRAPFTGVVLTKNADVGDIVTPIGAAANAKSAVVTMADMNSLLVETDVSESNIGKVKIGSACEITLDALPGDRFPASVHMIVPTADRTKAGVMVKVKFDKIDERILPEMSAKVAFLERPLNSGEETPFIAVAQNTILKSGDRNSVFVIREGRLNEVQVKTGRVMGEKVEVLSGVSAGDKVVASPASGLKSGAKVRIEE